MKSDDCSPIDKPGYSQDRIGQYFTFSPAKLYANRLILRPSVDLEKPGMRYRRLGP